MQREMFFNRVDALPNRLLEFQITTLNDIRDARVKIT